MDKTPRNAHCKLKTAVFSLELKKAGGVVT